MDVAVQDAYANQKLWAATTVKVLSTAKINLLVTPILYDLLLFNMQERSSLLRKLNHVILCWPTSKTLARLYHWRL